jgi:hypothetical protein
MLTRGQLEKNPVGLSYSRGGDTVGFLWAGLGGATVSSYSSFMSLRKISSREDTKIKVSSLNEIACLNNLDESISVQDLCHDTR